MRCLDAQEHVSYKKISRSYDLFTKTYKKIWIHLFYLSFICTCKITSATTIVHLQENHFKPICIKNKILFSLKNVQNHLKTLPAILFMDIGIFLYGPHKKDILLMPHNTLKIISAVKSLIQLKTHFYQY